LIDGETSIPVTVRSRRSGTTVTLPDGDLDVSGNLDDDSRLRAVIGGIAINAGIVYQPSPRGGSLDVMFQEVRHRLLVVNPLAVVGDDETDGGRLTAPMPGRIKYAVGDWVGEGETLVDFVIPES
jgi:hypothetical protein